MNFARRHLDGLLTAALVLTIAGSLTYRAWYLHKANGAASAAFAPNYMDRHTLSDNLLYIFGPQAGPTVTANLFDLGGPIGGNCDFYKQTYDSHQRVVDPLSRCPAGARDLNTPMFVKPNPVRLAAIRKTCRQLTDNPQTLAHALARVDIAPASPVELKPLSALYFMFYKAPLEGPATDQWKTYVTPSQSWAAVVYELCVSPGWQIL